MYRRTDVGSGIALVTVAQLDRIMVSRELRVTDCGVHPSACARKASDHLPIWAVLEVV